MLWFVAGAAIFFIASSCLAFSIALCKVIVGALMVGQRSERPPSSPPRMTNSDKLRIRRDATFDKYQIPPPGTKLERYERVKSLLDAFEADRNEARSAAKSFQDGYERATQELAALRAKYADLQARMDVAEEVLKAVTHAGLQIRSTKTIRLRTEDAEKTRSVTETS